MSNVLIGYDIGFSGGIVTMVDGEITSMVKMPLVGGDLDIIAIAKVLNKHKGESRHLITERFSGFFGYSKKATASVAMQSGKIQAICALLKIPFTAVTPKQWQSVMWVGTTVQYKKVKGKNVKDTKKTSILAATKLFPGVSFIPKGCRTPQDGLVDAALLADFGRRGGF